MPQYAANRHAASSMPTRIQPGMRLAAIAALLCAAVLPAQTRRGPAPEAPQNVTRAVAVYEWTGDLAKPTAARVIPVSLFIDQHFEDAALYLSRPVPMALQTGTVYELQTAGANRGTITLQTASRAHTMAGNGFDDGWFGFASYKPVPKAPVVAVNTAPSNAHVIVNDGRPHFAKRPPADTSSPASTTTASTEPPPDPNRPTLHHTNTGDPQSAPAQQPASASTPTTTSSAPPPAPTTATPAPSADPDRPTLKHAAPQTKKQKHGSDDASVTDAGGLLAEDPNRPHLHHGASSGAAAALPPLKGLPANMQQMAALSDAADRPEHDFTYIWPDATQQPATLARLETLARAALPAPAPAAPAPHTAAHARSHKPTPPPTPVAFVNEQLHAFEISYGGANVFVFTAQTAGEGPDLHYITLLAQPDVYGELHVLLQSVTDAAHLDRTPWMRFVDAIDADGDNRAELLFELRGQTQRQFVLYRVAQGTAQQAFATGTTP